MKNVIILGSGRSGTSLMAGALSRCGYFFGDSMVPPDEANPKGFFEDIDVNRINEDILRRYVPARLPGVLGDLLTPTRTVYWQRWLAAVSRDVSAVVPPSIAERIERKTARAPYCFKDPRFSYTLPAWKPFLRDIVYICVFRRPADNLHSLLAEARRDSEIRGVALRFSVREAAAMWHSMYGRILDRHHKPGEEWVFVEYSQLMDGSGYAAIEQALGVNVQRSFAERRLERSNAGNVGVPPRLLSLYARLQSLSREGS